jgi:hypothetical protein
VGGLQIGTLEPVPGTRGCGTWLVSRLLLKLQNTYERTVFADVLERIDAVMHVRGFVESVRRFFVTDRLNSCVYLSVTGLGRFRHF